MATIEDGLVYIALDDFCYELIDMLLEIKVIDIYCECIDKVNLLD